MEPGIMMRILLACCFSVLLAMPAAAQNHLGNHPGTITTHATERTRLPNTVADVTLGIEARATNVASVHKALSDGAAPLLAYLRGAGVDRLGTDQVTITPETNPNQTDRIAGYTGRMQVSFRVAADKLGDVLGGAMGKGVNTIDSTQLLPRESEVAATRQELAAKAVKTALAQARVVAEAAGRRLGAVQQILVDPGLGLVPRPMPMMTMRMAEAAPISTEAGGSDVAATVSVIVDLIEP